MADLNTNINIVIQNLKKVKDLGKTFKDAAKDAERIENKIKAINANLNRAKQKFNTVDPDMPRDKKGRFVKDADRNRRRNAYAELRMQKARQLTEKRVVQRELELIERKQKLLKAQEAGARKRAQIEEKSLQRTLKLRAAQGLVSRKLREAGSAGLSPTGFGGGEGKRAAARRVDLNNQVNTLKEGFNDLRAAGNKNIETYRALGSELSRTVEELNALNKASARRSVGFEKGRRLQERIDTVAASGYGKTSQIAAARKSAANVIAAGKTGDQNLYNQALSKATAQVSRLERAYKEAETVQKKASDHNKKAQRRLRNIRKIRQDRNDRTRESLMLGAGFPLLFGGGIGAVAGGVGGALAQRGGKGFGAQILFSAIGQQFDKLISSMVSSTAKLGQALGQYNQNTEQLITSLGLAGTAEGQRIKIIETLQGKQAAFNAAMQQLVNAVGEKGAADLKIFGDNLRLVGSEFRIFFTKVQAGLAGILNLADKILRFSEGAQESRVSRFAETTTNSEIAALRDRRDKILQSSGGGRSGAKNRSDSVKEIEAQMQRLAAPALARQDAGTAVDTIMLKQKELTKTLEEEFAVHAKILELQKEKGLSAELAKSVAQEAVIIDKTTEALQERFNELKDKGINKTLEEVELQKAIKQALDGQSDALDKIIQKKKNMSADTEKVKVKWEDIKETIASGLTSAVEGLIAGTKSLGESLAGIAKSIASMYLKAAFMNMLPTNLRLAEGGYVANGIKPFASGGYATRPTVGLVGEAGEDEYIIPASKMAASMQRYSAGARGEAVIPGTGSSHVGAGGGASTTVNYSGPILNFNSEEFVPKSAVGQIIATATSQGAKAGENRTLTTLRNSRSTRSRLGM